MSGLDGIVAGVADDIVPGLQYSLATKRGAQYVKQRNSSTFYPNTSNTYSIASGQRTIRVLISDAGSSMLDLSTVRIACRINNTGGEPLLFTGRHLACMFMRATTRIKGVLVDDVQYYNRLVGMLQSFKPANANYSDGVGQLGTGYSDTANVLSAITVSGAGAVTASSKANVAEGIRLLGPDVDPIPANSSRRVIFDLPGISALNNHYLLPLGRYPLEIQLELVKDPKDVLASGFLNPDGSISGTKTTPTTSMTFTIDEVEVKADTLLLDSAVTNNIEEALVGGKPLSLHLRPWNVTLYNISGTSTFSQIFNRAYSRLLSIFVNFLPKKLPDSYAALWTESNLFSSWHGHTDETGFFPGKKPQYNATRDEFRYQVQLGSHLYPNTAIRSHAESYYHLQKCVGELTTGVGVSTGPTYRSTNFHLATDFEKVASTPAGQADFSGVNTKVSGEQMRLFFEKITTVEDMAVGTAEADKWSFAPDIMYICANYDQIVQLRLEGVVLAD